MESTHSTHSTHPVHSTHPIHPTHPTQPTHSLTHEGALRNLAEIDEIAITIAALGGVEVLVDYLLHLLTLTTRLVRAEPLRIC